MPANPYSPIERWRLGRAKKKAGFKGKKEGDIQLKTHEQMSPEERQAAFEKSNAGALKGLKSQNYR